MVSVIDLTNIKEECITIKAAKKKSTMFPQYSSFHKYVFSLVKVVINLHEKFSPFAFITCVRMMRDHWVGEE